MKKDVIISIYGLQQADGMGDENVTLVTQGSYYRHGGQYFVSYEESELTGLSGTRTTLRVGDDGVTVLRTGLCPSQLVFEKGRKHTSIYETDFGGLMVSINTQHIDKKLDDDGGSIDVKYALEIGGAHTGTNHLKVDIKNA